MAFTCKIVVPSIPGDRRILLAWALEERVIISSGQVLATVTSSAGKFEIRSNMNGVLGRIHARAGTPLEEVVVLADILADGEDIPYGAPYVTVAQVAGDVSTA